MSTLTKSWTEDKIRSIIHNLDKKTGLRGATLPIRFTGRGSFLGYYYHGEEKYFGFKPSFINNPNTKESEVIDVIRHEYAHYYVDVASLEHYIGHSARETSHGNDWKWACKMVGADPIRCHNANNFRDRNWSIDEAIAAYNADDVTKFDILSYLDRWHCVPLDSDVAAEALMRIRERNPDDYYELGDEVVHPKRGFGMVFDTRPCGYLFQKVYVLFDDDSDGIFETKELCKVVGGVVVMS